MDQLVNRLRVCFVTGDFLLVRGSECQLAVGLSSSAVPVLLLRLKSVLVVSSAVPVASLQVGVTDVAPKVRSLRPASPAAPGMAHMNHIPWFV